VKVNLHSNNATWPILCLTILGLTALSAGLIAGIGWVLSAVLSWFGLSLVWWKCSIIWIVIGFIGSAFRGKEN
jgi:hypothetical protein